MKLFNLFKKKTAVLDVTNILKERRPLPLGGTEFEEWSDRIISGSLLTATPESQKFALATMLMHLPPQEDHCEDMYFIKSLRKSAVNQVAHAKMEEIRDTAKARLAAEEEAKKPHLVVEAEKAPKSKTAKVEVKNTVSTGGVTGEVLANP